MREDMVRHAIRRDFMVFLAEGQEGVGAVHDIGSESFSVYVENFGEFIVPLAAVQSVHDQKVVLDRGRVSAKFLRAVAHAHDGEDPKVAG